MTSQEIIALEEKYGAHNYAPVPVVIAKGKGAEVWDPEGKQYLDFLSGICAVSQGHCHPRLVKTVTEQVGQLTLVSRAFYSDQFGPFAQYITSYFGYQRVLMMNTGVEAFETACKLARKWGYTKKGVAENCAKILVAEGNFHGRTLAAISASTAADSLKHFGPGAPGFVSVPFGDVAAVERALEDTDVVAFIVEPIQGEGGVILPPNGYLKGVRAACTKANALWVADEIQTGIGRTGKLLACDYEEVRPDVVLLGKSLSGGILPVSAVLADDAVMLVLQPGDHGSTFGGNALACAVARTALEIVKDENLTRQAEDLGKILRLGLREAKLKWVKEVRGRGLLNAIELEANAPVKASALCVALRDAGILAKNSRETVIRFAPPLVITEAQLELGLQRIRAAWAAVASDVTGG